MIDGQSLFGLDVELAQLLEELPRFSHETVIARSTGRQAIVGQTSSAEPSPVWCLILFHLPDCLRAQRPLHQVVEDLLSVRVLETLARSEARLVYERLHARAEIAG